MAYVNSEQIRVFPSVGRSNYDIESQLMNENNISQIVRSLCRERKSYVLSTELSTGSFEFVIYGFYFKILNASNTLSSITSGENVKEIWAGIKIDADAEANNQSSNYQLLQLANTTAENNEIIDLDREDQFEGIIFGTTEDEVNGGGGENYYTLLLLTKDTGTSTFKVPAQSLLHLNTTEILDGASSNYISDKFTTKQLDASESISDAGTLTVSGTTTLNTLTANNTQITGTLSVEGHTTLASVTATFVSAPTFSGSLSGNATTATNLSDERTFSFTGGDISGSATSSTGGYNITASIIDAHVTTGKIADEAVTNDKLADGTIKKEKLGFDLSVDVDPISGDQCVLIIKAPSSDK